MALFAATRLAAASTVRQNIQISRAFSRAQPALLASEKKQSMPQVEVDDPNVAQKLGSIQMNFVKKAEEANAVRVEHHIKFRRRDFRVAGLCFALIIAIYSYTIFAIKQETFLDDFDLPDPMDAKNTGSDLKD